MDLTPRAARALARAAYLWAYPLVVNYGKMYEDATGSALPPGRRRVGPWLRHQIASGLEGDPERLTNTAVTWSVWLDLRETTCLLTVPTMDARCSGMTRATDLWGFLTHADLLRGANGMLFVLTGEADRELEDIDQFRNIDQFGNVDQVVPVDQAFIRLEVLVRLSEAVDVDEAVASIQNQLALDSVNQSGSRVAIAPVPRIDWRPYHPDVEVTKEFWPTANFALALVEPHGDDRKILERIGELGIVPGRSWDETVLPPKLIEAIEMGMDDAINDLLRASAGAAHPTDAGARLSRTALDQDYFARALAAVRFSRLSGRR